MKCKKKGKMIYELVLCIDSLKFNCSYISELENDNNKVQKLNDY